MANGPQPEVSSNACTHADLVEKFTTHPLCIWERSTYDAACRLIRYGWQGCRDENTLLVSAAGNSVIVQLTHETTRIFFSIAHETV